MFAQKLILSTLVAVGVSAGKSATSPNQFELVASLMVSCEEQIGH